jgi:hypothetical protein
MKDFTSPLRKKASRLYRTYRALLILSGSLTRDERERLDLCIAGVERLPKRQLQEELPKLEKEVLRMSARFGLRASIEELEDLLKPATLENPLVYVNKIFLQELFASYDEVLTDFSNLPPHARIGIDAFSVLDTTKIEVFILEAALFEDMATLWNLTLKTAKPYRPNTDKQDFKRSLALTRATAKAVFNFVEGYLNGMATDTLVTEVVSDAQKTKLLEWDNALSRPRHLSLREKLLQYPKLAIGATHPLLDEGNCREIKSILRFEQDVRHSLIHPTPQFFVHPSQKFREGFFHQNQLAQVGELCDLAVELVFKLNASISEKYGKVDEWLFRRNPDGKFPPEVFT